MTSDWINLGMPAMNLRPGDHYIWCVQTGPMTGVDASPGMSWALKRVSMLPDRYVVQSEVTRSFPAVGMELCSVNRTDSYRYQGVLSTFSHSRYIVPCRLDGVGPDGIFLKLNRGTPTPKLISFSSYGRKYRMACGLRVARWFKSLFALSGMNQENMEEFGISLRGTYLYTMKNCAIQLDELLSRIRQKFELNEAALKRLDEERDFISQKEFMDSPAMYATAVPVCCSSSADMESKAHEMELRCPGAVKALDYFEPPLEGVADKYGNVPVVLVKFKVRKKGEKTCTA